MKITFLIGLVSIPFLLNAQEGLTDQMLTNDKKVEALKCRDTRFRLVPDCANTVYFDQGSEATMHKKSGKPFTGACKVCHMNGNLEMFLTFAGGRPQGVDTVWYDNGNPNLIRSHDTEGLGKEDGQWKFYRKDGSLKWEKNFVMGAMDGETRYYFPDSSLWKVETWKMGSLDGKKQEFWPNNTLKKEIMHKDGEWNGKYITYFESGMVESEQEFKMGKKEGLSRYYYDTGALLYEENHVDGCREGETRRFYLKDERKWTVENYKGNLRHGVFEEYYDNEKNTKKYYAIYKKGVVVEEHFYDEFGDETSAPEGSPFATKDEAADAKKWPETPSADWLKENGLSRKQYDKKRKNYFKYKAKQAAQQSTSAGC
ncbi:MAG: toxin-antitoxin system YwqK family antitoxin [Crocinitomicaceae bacterium]